MVKLKIMNKNIDRKERREWLRNNPFESMKETFERKKRVEEWMEQQKPESVKEHFNSLLEELKKVSNDIKYNFQVYENMVGKRKSEFVVECNKSRTRLYEHTEQLERLEKKMNLVFTDLIKEQIKN